MGIFLNVFYAAKLCHAGQVVQLLQLNNSSYRTANTATATGSLSHGE
jgi:hypothetical protein